MVDQKPGEDAKTSSSDKNPYWILRTLRKIKDRFQQRRAKKKKESPINRAAKSTARATWAIAILTVVTIGVGVSQYFIFSSQLSVMQGQLDTMEDDQRPWLKATIGLKEIDILENGDIYFHLSQKVTNVGKTPAQKVYETIVAVPFLKDDFLFLRFPQLEREQCNVADKYVSSSRIGIYFIFPGNDYFENTFGIKVESDKYKSLMKDGKVSFAIIGCVTYAFSNNQIRRGHTGFGYNVVQRTKDSNNDLAIIPGTLNGDHAGIYKDVFNGSFVD